MELSQELSQYTTSRETAKRWGVCWAWVMQYLTAGRVSGAVKINNTWFIPKNAEKPADKRYTKRKK